MNKKLLTLSYSLLTMLLLTSCDKTGGIEKIFNENEDFTLVAESTKNASEASFTYLIVDNGVEVYKSEKKVVVESKEITTTITSLQDSFAPVTKTTTTIDSKFTTDSLFTYTLNKTYFDFTLYSDNKITGIINKEKAKNVFNVEEFSSFNSPTLTMTFDASNLASYEVSYTTESSKNVTISASYTYMEVK